MKRKKKCNKCLNSTDFENGILVKKKKKKEQMLGNKKGVTLVFLIKII